MKMPTIGSAIAPLATAGLMAAALALPAWGEEGEKDSGGDVEAAPRPAEAMRFGVALPAPRPGVRSRFHEEVEDSLDCLEERGIPGFHRDEHGGGMTLPAPGEDFDPEELREQMREFREAAEDCGMPVPPLLPLSGRPPGDVLFAGGHGEVVQLTDAEIEAGRQRMEEWRQCMEERGFDTPAAIAAVVPGRGAGGSLEVPAPAPNTARDEGFSEAAEACGGPPEIVISPDAD